MQVILRNEEQWNDLIDKVFTLKPDSYPCLAFGRWVADSYGPDGWEYEYVYLIDETRDDLTEKYSLDLTKL